MPRCKITHSLLTSWLYALKENPYEDATTERDAYAEFLTVLRREPTETTEAMQRGIDFENMVTDIVNGVRFRMVMEFVEDENGRPKEVFREKPLAEHPWYNAAAQVASAVAGGPLQVNASKPITVDGIDLLLTGRLDSLRAGVIRDIKFSKSYDRGKFITSTQHPAYFEIVPGAYAFEYVVSNGTDVWTERYEREETRSIIPIISDFLSFLRDNGLLALYQEKWKVGA